jgi:bifunctional non-homologous end joining protein LigD
MSLETYRAKRRFETTPEPKGRKAKAKGRGFVVQKHAARRLHYDLRLELDGVLKSWAVTRGPSLVPGDKRLAVAVEDHPIDYGTFEGTIPEGEYGGGTVIVWDRGLWQPVGDPHKGLAKGHLDFSLEGEKLRGKWHLVRMARKPRDKHENWLLIKSDDEAARDQDDPDILEERPESVKTTRRIDAVAGEPPGWSSKTGRIMAAPNEKWRAARPAPAALKGARKAPMPAFVPPALATSAKKAPSGARWIHEIKFDGYRLQARLEGGRVSLVTRGGLDWTDKFGSEIVAAFEALPVDSASIDGELVVETEAGISDFSGLQADLSEGRSDRFVFYAFDLLYLDGQDLRGVPLEARKSALADVLSERSARLRPSEHFEDDGEVVRRHACRLGLEGIVSKRRDRPYRSGRTADWLKAKCVLRQEFVIGGFMPSTTSREAIGSLTLGLYEGGALVPVGRAGTGFTTAVAEGLFRRLSPLRVAKSPFSRPLGTEAARHLRYVAPELVAEVEFRGFTADGNLRQAAFKGLREDKPAREVIREEQAETMPDQRRSRIELTHPDRVYWPDVGVTKEGLADYYTGVWPRIAPFVTGRPLALLRCPEGIAGQCFFQKHPWNGLDRSIRLCEDPKNKDEGPILTIDDLDGLIALVQAGVLEIHPWGSTTTDIERPDMMIFDLDPGENVSWRAVIDAAFEVRRRLASFGMTGFVKTSGGKGLHVVAPLQPKATWPTAKSFAKSIADQMTADSPDHFVATITKSKRHGKILVDYLRNGRGATAVAPYSTRARPGAPVSLPIGWTELESIAGPAYFTLANAPVRLANLATDTSADPWDGFRAAAIPVPVTRSGQRVA